MDDRRIRLYERFRQQQRFASERSPLIACLCGVVAQWLDPSSGEDELALWLIRTSLSCSSLAVPMLLMAALHQAILADDPCASVLRGYFPSVGGRQPVDAEKLSPLLRQVTYACRERLSTAFATSVVQTNETARGLCWLLPVLYTGWPAIHLVDLGCSAGLNLVAEQRQYRLCLSSAESQDMIIGMGAEEEFVIPCRGDFVAPQQWTVPQLLSRLGCDRHPFFLKNEVDEQRLASYVWADQVDRMLMLRQGIAALHRVEHSTAPVQLFAADLPHDLDVLLAKLIAQSNRVPVVVYNTYLTSYLSCKGRGLETSMERWAKQQKAPVLWLQWEPVRQNLYPPGLGWLGWTADLWVQGERRRWHLAWVHPHGAEIEWLADLAEWGTGFSPATSADMASVRHHSGESLAGG